MQYISLIEEAALAVRAGESRLAKARLNLENFLAEYGDMAATAELRESFEREKDVLVTEVDAAERFYRKCCEDLEELKQRQEAPR